MNLQTLDISTFISKVSKQSGKYANQAVVKAKTAHLFQNIMLCPGVWKLMEVAIQHLKWCPITRADILAMEDIYGPNLC